MDASKEVSSSKFTAVIKAYPCRFGVRIVLL